jgi:hypothetical protein
MIGTHEIRHVMSLRVQRTAEPVADDGPVAAPRPFCAALPLRFGQSAEVAAESAATTATHASGMGGRRKALKGFTPRK